MATKPKTTAVAVKKATGGNVVSIQERLKQQVAAMAERVGAPGGDVIILKNHTFKFPDGTEIKDSVRLVVVDFISMNSFYDGPYDEKNPAPPACFSIDTVITKMVPDKDSPVAQSDSCAACPMNQFGSSGNGKACKNTRVLAVLPVGADADTPLSILKVSPTGLKSFDAFVTSTVRSFGVPPLGVTVEVSFDENVTYPSLRFSNVEPNDEAEIAFNRQEEAKQRLAVKPDVSQYAAPAPARKAAAPRAGARR